MYAIAQNVWWPTNPSKVGHVAKMYWPIIEIIHSADCVTVFQVGQTCFHAGETSASFDGKVKQEDRKKERKKERRDRC